MGINMALAGVPDSLGILVPFLVLTVLVVAAAVVLLRNVDAPASGQAAAPAGELTPQLH